MSRPPPASADTIRLRSSVLRGITDGAAQACPNCGRGVDVTHAEPLTPITCPFCQRTFPAHRDYGSYTLQKVLGESRLSVLYRAFDRTYGRLVALKLVREDFRDQPEYARRIEAEATAMGAINEPHVARVYFASKKNGRLYIASEIFTGGSLQERIDRAGLLGERHALEIALQCAFGLRAALRHGLLHHNLKPSNVLFANEHAVKLVDFGLSLPWLPGGAAANEAQLGDPRHLSPERVAGLPEDVRSDIYSLGCTLFHAFSGRPPFLGETPLQTALLRLEGPAPDIQQAGSPVSDATATLVAWMLARQPEERLADYDKLIELLEIAVGEHEKKRVQMQAREAAALAAAGKKRAEPRRGVITLSLLTMLALAMLALILAPDGLFERPAAPEASAPIAAGEHGSHFTQARQLLIAGMSDEAAAEFHTLVQDPATPPAMLQWSILQEGLSQLAAGQLARARVAFKAMGQNPYHGATGKGTQLAKVFTETARRAGNEESAPVELSAQIDKSGPASLELLILGLKNWELGRFEEAAVFLQEFTASAPSGDAAWIAEYKPLARSYLADYQAYRSLADGLAANGVAFDGYDADEKVKAFLGKARHKGKLTQHVENLVAEAVARTEQSAKVLDSVTPELEAAFTPIDLRGRCTADGRKGLFSNPNSMADAMFFHRLGFINVQGVLFDIIDPAETQSGLNLIILKGGSAISKLYPQRVELQVPKIKMRKLHILGGVAGWGWPFDSDHVDRQSPLVKISLVHASGLVETFEARNGMEIGDYRSGTAEVPGSRRVMGLLPSDRQIRTFSIPVNAPNDPVEKIILESSDLQPTPLFAALTAELATGEK